MNSPVARDTGFSHFWCKLKPYYEKKYLIYKNVWCCAFHQWLRYFVFTIFSVTEVYLSWVTSR